ncbi:hypothetical protein [Streptomyces mirabilis]|uniref:hypothetical protein n=1 Tax=Streptomyces mirabilis TaxID=68239 RepID=UPI003F4D333A
MTGKDADVILLRADDITVVPVTDPAGTIVAAGHPGLVDTVLVAGRPRDRTSRRPRSGSPHVIRRGRRLAREVGDIQRRHRPGPARTGHPTAREMVTARLPADAHQDLRAAIVTALA